MTTKQRIFCIFAVLITLLIDTSLIPFTGLNTAYCPRFCLLSVITIAALTGKTNGISYGAFAGTLLGYTVYQPHSFTIIIFVICGLIAGFCGRLVSKPMASIIPYLFAIIVYEAAHSITYYFSSGTLSSALMLNALIRIGTGFLAEQVVFFAYSRIIKRGIHSSAGKSRIQ